MIEYLLSFLLILITWVVYKFIVKPKMLFNRYARDLEGMGYKVYKDFRPFGIILLNDLLQGKKDGDPFKIFKTVYRDYDVILGNSTSKVYIDFSHPDFIKDYFKNENLYSYTKEKFVIDPVVKAMGRGILFSEDH